MLDPTHKFRSDPMSGNWVVVAMDKRRAGRPHGLGDKDVCVFCRGNEHKTPSTILALKADLSETQGTDWHVRVTPNMFNVLEYYAELRRVGFSEFWIENGVGAHEVIVDHPYEDHRHPADFTANDWKVLITAWKLRMLAFSVDDRFKYPVLFKNHGKEAGTSLEHPHSQLIVMPIVPPSIMQKLDNSRHYYSKKRCCLLCRIIDDEYAAQERIVWENKSLVAWCYFAGELPYELWLAPKRDLHHHCFEQYMQIRGRVEELAEAFVQLLTKLRSATNDANFNIVLHTAPWFHNDERSNGSTIEHDFHWHFEIKPRMTKLAGFEINTEMYINPVPPEIAAKELRDVIV